MKERQLSAEEVKVVYEEIYNLKLQAFDSQFYEDCSEFYYELNGKQYRLIYDRPGDWFCDIIYEAIYMD